MGYFIKRSWKLGDRMENLSVIPSLFWLLSPLTLVFNIHLKPCLQKNKSPSNALVSNYLCARMIHFFNEIIHFKTRQVNNVRHDFTWAINLLFKDDDIS